ncbi:2,3,4,5-tetrahydropyridine-2,6-dicarboxylate N-succinyltransferase [Candidatus Comchoanobacter bicostacola]|uniref:2,3,4,5-tetrahydropyridine-2,6-dicarboxylate N-succinyltransferase n=1 Tax=Candidatus Comchoanobacter bicostacola TaxID=2919598 RepID=A0ABY5DJ20_9GAMM|nr:2,3,4,5-tetrahydropyridine-2,6-dicarboxylate N-succinyltransferase [Candidatus Comchoanobacter bicostacola]UTC24336.1 2,3,4,5-tetrahydropyridine-2,6-dicarboxylate N-succinyltransferase [Candidatus Comchoanobacter bicostacola]
MDKKSSQCLIIYDLMLEKKEIDSAQFSILKSIINDLDTGTIRICAYEKGQWTTNEWVKKAIIAYIHYAKPDRLTEYSNTYRDHSIYKYSKTPIPDTIRIVPPAHIRFGAYIGKRTVIMPSFINIGCYVDDGSMIDSFASLGSGAQIGKNVHISAGTGIGGVLEPLQALPTIIEDNCFIGGRSEISEGVIVRSGAVVASGVFLTQSTRIYNRMTGETSYGEIPPNAVVIPGTLPTPNETYQASAAIIVKYADEKTRSKTTINDLLRPHI